MAEAAVSFLLENLREVAIGYTDLIRGAKDDLEQLYVDFKLLKAILMDMENLMDMEKEKEKDDRFWDLEKRIREVVYEVEDTIETCLTKAIAAKANKSRRRAAIYRISSEQFSLAKEVRSIREVKVRPLVEDVLSYLNMCATLAGAMEDPPAIIETDIPTPIGQKRVVGFEDQVKIITGYLKDRTNEVDVISIMGMPGQGKTTLARKIYQSKDIVNHFPICIWINISHSFNTRDVFLQILRKFAPSQDMSNLNHDELVQTVRGCLEKEKFLLVLDDVWRIEVWDKISVALPLDNGEGKVLITSREIDVRKRSNIHRDPHKLRFLDKDESWTLLQYEVFGNLEDCPQELSDIGKHIAIKYGGVPLTIVVIGCILADQLAKSLSWAVNEWERVSKNVSEALQSDETQRITSVVELSFRRLPHELRECFLFLGVFPEDYEIPAKMLCRLWISEGFVQLRQGSSLEECAEDNMNDLIGRNFLKVEKTNHMGKVKTCRVDDMIRAFCISISKKKNLYQEIKISKQGALEPSVSEVRNSYRLCFSSNLSKFLSESPCGPRVRSFLCFHEPPVYLEPKYISVIADGFEKLRILESKCIKFDEFPEKLTKLTHLRYLTLYIETLKILPKSITELPNLESLVVETKSRSITMKADIWTLSKLRCLKTRAAIVLDNKCEGKAGDSLHTLNRLAPESCTEAVSGRATNLKTLGISGELARVFETDFLEKLHELEKLKLQYCLTNGFPQRNCFPPNLKRLTLTKTSLGWQHMPTLAMIKSLETLKLKDNAFVGVSWRVADYSFPSLQHLLMVNMDLILWEVLSDAFPKLRCLVVNDCENLREIPERLGVRLQKLEIYRLRPSVVESAMKIQERRKCELKDQSEVRFSLTHSITDLENILQREQFQ